MLCIFHSRDLDGYSSGAIVKKRYPDTILVGYDYGQKLTFPEGINLADHNVIMIDVSLDDMADMFALANKCKSLTFIDHHVSAIKKYEAVKDQAPSNFITVLENGISACEGGWKYLFPNEKMPDGIRLLGEYDTFRNNDKKHWEDEVMPFQYGMRLLCNSPETFPQEIFDIPNKHNNFIVETMIAGTTVLKYQSMINEAQCKRAFEYEFEGLRAICLNGGGFSSDVFKSVYDESKHDVMMPFQFDGKQKQWILSMYTTKDIDCSEIAIKYGGGGHAKACGFSVLDIYSIFLKTHLE